MGTLGTVRSGQYRTSRIGEDGHMDMAILMGNFTQFGVFAFSWWYFGVAGSFFRDKTAVMRFACPAKLLMLLLASCNSLRS